MATYVFKKILMDKINSRGGWINTHAHIDRANTITPANIHIYEGINENLKKTGSVENYMQEKWVVNDSIKRNSTVDDYYDRMSEVVEDMIGQGVKALGTNIDIDPVVEDKVMKAASRLRENYGDKIILKFSNQLHYGVLTKETRYWFDKASEFVDIIGGLPEADGDRDAEHIDILMETAKRYNKMVHCHVDQMHKPSQKQTELLVDKTLQYGLEGRVAGVHCISLATQQKDYRQMIYKKMQDADFMVICCSNAWIDTVRNETLMPWHNSTPPVDELLAHGITVGLGTDTIGDVYTPFNDGDMWSELKTTIHACHLSDIDQMADLATTNGQKILGLNQAEKDKIANIGETVEAGNISLKIKNSQKVDA